MKSIHEMTGAEMEAARKAKTPYYGTEMYRYLDTGKTILSDVEDYCPFTLRKRIADMKNRGWREVPNNRYIVKGMHPETACNKADANFAKMAAGGPPCC